MLHRLLWLMDSGGRENLERQCDANRRASSVKLRLNPYSIGRRNLFKRRTGVTNHRSRRADCERTGGEGPKGS